MRIAKWDNVKFILMITVVFGHMAAQFNTGSSFLKDTLYFVYLFHMPAFLYVSGLFSKKTVQQKRYSKIIPFLILYLFMKIFRLAVYRTVLGINYKFKIFEENGVPWFILVLFLCHIVTIVVREWKPAYAMVFFVVLGIASGYDNDLGNFLALRRLIVFYSFFLAGYYTETERLQAFVGRTWVKITSVALLLGTYIYCFADKNRIGMNFLKGKASFKELECVSYGWLMRGGWYLLAMALVLAVIALVPVKECVISLWGKRTLQVYAIHFEVIKILTDVCHLEKWCAKIWPDHYALLVPVLAVLLTVVLSLKFLTPFFDWLMNPYKKEKI